jgi:hypothetical protein
VSAVAIGNRGRRRFPPVVKITFGVIAFVGVGLILKGAISPGSPSQCVSNSSQPPSSAGGGEAYFTSSQYGFTFGYPSVGQRINVTNGVTGYNFFVSTGNFAGQMLVAAGMGHPTLSYIVDNEAKTLGGSSISNMDLSGPMNGAEVGFEPGVGNMYTGEFTDSVGNVHPVQIGVIAVQHGNEWVSMVGIGTTSSSNPSPLIFSVFDDVLDQWRWTG